MFYRPLFKQKIGLLALLSCLAITCITFFKSAMELEDAEQAYYSQWLRWGYDDQPPLYTWLQYGVNQVFGVHKVSFSLLRGLIFAGVLVAIGQFVHANVQDRKNADFTVFALVLIPVFVDLTFRRLSHTSLLCLAILATVILIQRLLLHKTSANYALLGFVVSIGMLSKYNYVLFLGAFGLSLFFDKGFRGIVFNKKILVSVFLVALLLFPHFYWLLGPDGYFMELQESIALKTENSTENGFYVITPLFSLLGVLFKLFAPLLLVLALAFGFRKITLHKPKWDWPTKLALAQLLVLVLFFVFLNVQKQEERWLLPLVLPFMLLWFRSVAFKAIGKWHGYGFILFVTVIGIQVVRTPIEKVLEIPSSVHFGFEPLSNVLQQRYPTKLWMLPDVTYGGSISVLNPEKEIFSNDDFSLPKCKLVNVEGVEVLIGNENLKGRKPLVRLLDFGKEKDTLFIVDLESDALLFY